MRPERSDRRMLSSIGMLLDANVFLEVELAERHAEACKALLRKVRDGIIISAITDFHVDSIALIMESHGKGWKGLALFFASLLRYKGLRIHPVGLNGRIRAISMMRDYGLDFDDAIAVQAIRELSIDTIVSYDDDFDSVDWVKRRTPESLL